MTLIVGHLCCACASGEVWSRALGVHQPTSFVCFKNLLMPLFLMGCFPVDFQKVKRPLRTQKLSLELETSTGVLANFSRELANFKRS